MRLPLVRFGEDDRPCSWWEWFFLPVVMTAVAVVLGGAALVAIPFFAVYPELHMHEYDLGTERQQEAIRRFRRYASRVSFWRRCGRVLAFPFRRKRARRPVRSNANRPGA